MNHGLVFGKFLPVHKGHVYLIEQAQRQCDRLTVFLCTLDREPIPGDLRVSWLRTLFPDVEVVHCREDLPQYPQESAAFWDTWVGVVQSYVARDIDCLFTSEDYGIEFARRLGIAHVMVDRNRTAVPVSGTLIRDTPYQYWDYIPTVVRPYFMKKVVLTGPESTGKTITSQLLAEHYRTMWVPEYGREYTDLVKHLTLEDFTNIASGQLALEHRIAIQASQVSKLLICDTDLIVTQIFGEIMVKGCPRWIIETNEKNARKYDLYLLMSPDIPWVNDGTREYGDIRDWHFRRLQQELVERETHYVIIDGTSFEERTRKAIIAVDDIMKGVA